MSGDPPDLVWNIAEDLRVISLDALREGGCDVPDRNYIEIGEVLAPVEFTDDCESQLTVMAGPLSPDLFTDIMQRRQGKAQAAMLWKAAYQITLLRCHPTTSGMETSPLATIEQLNAEARDHYRDMWQLARVLSWKWTHDELVPSFPFDAENMQWNSPAVTVRPPRGGIRGMDIRFTISLHDHYVPEDVTSPF